MYTILLIIFQFVSCDNWGDSLKEGICAVDDKNKYHIEDTIFAFRQMWNRKAILIVYIFYVVSIALYNIVGINLTKLVSSTARAVVDTVRTVFIWLFFICFEPVPNTRETFRILQFIGFCFLVFGTLVYNEILVIRFCNLDYYTRDNIRKRKNEKEQERLYVSVDGKDSSAHEDENNPTKKDDENEQKDENVP